MQRALGLSAAGTVGVIIAVVPYHAFLTTWAGYVFGSPLVWKSWKEIVLGLAIIGLLAASAMPRTRYRAAFMRVLRQPLTCVIFAYAALHLVLAAVYRNPTGSTLAGLMTNLRFLAILLTAQWLVAVFPVGSARLQRFATKATLVSGVVLAVLGIAQVFVLSPDFLAQFGYNKNTTIAPFITVDQNMGALRAFATMRGPNTLGMFFLLPLAMLGVLITRKRHIRLAVPAMALCIFALYLTGSRSAWLGALVTLVALLLGLSGKKRTIQLARRFGAPLVIALIGLAVLAESVPSIRLALFHSSPGDSSLTEGSTDKHGEATLNGAKDALAHPLGRGPGEAGPASFYSPDGARIAENYYVQVAQEVGLFGLILFMAILYLVGRRLWRVASAKNASMLALGLFASFWGIAVINLLLHGWADDPNALVWWGLAGLAILADNTVHDHKTAA